MNDPSLTEAEIQFYAEALQTAQAGPASTGYGRPINQQVRFASFASALATMNPESEEIVYSLLDVGCGTGDLLECTRVMGAPPTAYLGVDRDKRMIDVARERYRRDIEQGPFGAVEFGVGDAVTAHAELGKKKYDVTACIATLALKPEDWDQAQALKYIQSQIMYMAFHTKSLLFVTLFSTWKNNVLPNEMNVNPTTMFDWALQTFGRVTMDHSYAPHDFSLAIRLDQGPWWKEYRDGDVDPVSM